MNVGWVLRVSGGNGGTCRSRHKSKGPKWRGGGVTGLQGVGARNRGGVRRGTLPARGCGPPVPGGGQIAGQAILRGTHQGTISITRGGSSSSGKVASPWGWSNRAGNFRISRTRGPLQGSSCSHECHGGWFDSAHRHTVPHLPYPGGFNIPAGERLSHNCGYPLPSDPLCLPSPGCRRVPSCDGCSTMWVVLFYLLQ